MRKLIPLLWNGIWKENPILVLMLGLCPLLAVSTSSLNALGMGAAVIFVLTFSNLLISLIRKWVPAQIHIPVFIVIISTFVTITDYTMHAWLPALHKSLGVFVPLIVVNCIILARAEAFASKNPILESVFDGLGIGIGFMLMVFMIGFIREFLGNGTIFGSGKIFSQPAMIMILPPGAFITLGTIMALFHYHQERKSTTKSRN